MFNFKDSECQDEQFDGFKTDWEISQYLAFSKPDNIKHITGNTFKTKDDKTLKSRYACFDLVSAAGVAIAPHKKNKEILVIDFTVKQSRIK